ncbi:hypothetical protein V8F33_003457 [Rhypophila sp. PSN 637]
MTPWKTAAAFVALLLSAPLALAAPSRGDGGRGPGGRPGGQHGKTHRFGPGRRPGVNRKDFRKHLLPKNDVSLYYAAADEPGSISMNITMKTPAVILEDVEAITNVVCGAEKSSLTVSFSNPTAWSTAIEDWDVGGPVVLITNEDNGCSPDEERGFFVTDKVTFDETTLTVTLAASQQKIEELADDMEMEFSSLPAATLVRRIELNPKATISWSKSLPRTSVFKNQYVDIAAESASFSTKLTFSGHLKFSFLTWSVKSLYFDVAAAFDASAVVSANLMAQYSKSITYSPDAISWSVVKVPGIVSLGPGVAFGLQLDFSASGQAGITAGVGFALPAGLIHIDLKNSANSYTSGWKPVYTAYANLTQAAVVDLDVGANLKVEMAFVLLGGVVDLSSGIAATPAIANTFTLHGTQNVSPGGVLLPTATTCSAATNGVQLVSDFVFKVTAYVSKYWSKQLYSYETQILNKCYQFAK